MKKTLTLLATIAAIVLYCCTNEHETKTAELSVAPESLTYDTEVMANNIVTVTSNAEWSVMPSHTDLKLDKTRGKGNGSVTILSIPAGKSYTFTIKTLKTSVFTNEVSKTITVTRPANGSGGGGGNPDDGGDDPDDGGGTGGDDPDDGGDDPDDGGGTGGDDPDPSVPIFVESFGSKSVSGTQYADNLVADGYSDMSGSGAATVTYINTGARVRNDNYGSAGNIGTYEGASGGCYIRMPYSGNSIEVKDITLPNGATNLRLTFGAAQPPQNLSVYAGDGQKWVKLSYQSSDTYNVWDLAVADFTLTASRNRLSIRFVAEGSTSYGSNIDDLSLTIGEGGQEVDIQSGGTIEDEGNYTLDGVDWAELPSTPANSNILYVSHSADNGYGKRIRNFSMAFDKTKLAALWVAYPMHDCYLVKNTSRTDDWEYDPKIPSQYQPNLSSSYKNTSGGNYNRGHQIASADRYASREMNAQTFYYSNMTPQQSKFNGGIWGTLEDKVREQICSDTLYVVSGAHFDPSINMPSATDKDGVNTPAPTHYYKVMLRTKKGTTGKAVSQCSASELIAIGFWMEHPKTDSSLSGSVTNYAMSVAEIEELTGITFFHSVPNAPKSSFNLNDWNF